MLEKGMSKLWTDSDCARTNEKTLVLSVSTTVRSDKDESFYFHHTLTPLKGENWIEEYAYKDFLFSSITLKAISFGSTPLEIEAIPLYWTTSTNPFFVWSLFLGHKQVHKSYLRINSMLDSFRDKKILRICVKTKLKYLWGLYQN